MSRPKALGWTPSNYRLYRKTLSQTPSPAHEKTPVASEGNEGHVGRKDWFLRPIIGLLVVGNKFSTLTMEHQLSLEKHLQIYQRQKFCICCTSEGR